MVFYPPQKKNFLVELSINLNNLFKSGVFVQWPVPLDTLDTRHVYIRNIKIHFTTRACFSFSSLSLAFSELQESYLQTLELADNVQYSTCVAYPTYPVAIGHWIEAKSFVQDIDSLTSIRLVGNKYKIPNLVAENREKNNTKQLHDTKNYVI